jgi:site-specific recombinase XerD
MLNLFRWHTKRCPHDSRDSLKCQCPIWIDWTMINGQRVRKSLGLRDWQAAQRRAREMEAEGITAVGSPVTVKKATDDFEKDAESNIKDTTLKQYKILFKRLNEFCQQRGLVFLRQLTVVEAREFRNSWTTYSPRTAGKHIERMKRFFTWCVENRWLDQSPAQPLKSPKVGETDVVPFSEEEVEKILKACKSYEGPNRDRLVVLTLFMLATGLRISDAVTISKSKFADDGDGWMVELRTQKTGTSVACPIQSDLAESIMELEGDTPFWSGKSDLEDITKNWRKIYTRIFAAAKIDGHPHQFRHTFAKRLLAKGTPVGYVASLLGNTEEICRKHYAKWISERQTALNKAVRSTWSKADIRQTT